MSDFYLFKNALKELVRFKRILTALLLIAVPALLAIAWRTTEAVHKMEPDQVYDLLSGKFVFGFILVMLSVVFSTSVVVQDIEQKTIVYLLTRPVPRWRILLVKFIPAALSTIVTVWIASIVVALIVYGPHGLLNSRLKQDLLLLPVGALAYGALFLLTATLLNRPLIWGLLYGFGWEVMISNLLPGNFNKLSLMAYLRAIAPHLAPEPEAGDPTSLFASLAPQPIAVWLAWTVLSAVIAVCLVAALVSFSTREYVPREDLG